jgi:hypothetical protein
VDRMRNLKKVRESLLVVLVVLPERVFLSWHPDLVRGCSRTIAPFVMVPPAKARPDQTYRCGKADY